MNFIGFERFGIDYFACEIQRPSVPILHPTRWSARVSLQPDSRAFRDQICTTSGSRVYCVRLTRPSPSPRPRPATRESERERETDRERERESALTLGTHGGHATQWSTRVSLRPDSGSFRDQICTTKGPSVNCARPTADT